MTYRNPKLLSLAKGQPCVMCGAQDDTVVCAHSNLKTHGKGMGHKAHDGMTAWLCHACHFQLDQGPLMSKEERRLFTLESICKTYMQLWDQGLIKVNQ